MAEKQKPPEQGGTPPARADEPPRNEQDYRLLCRRYSRLRSRLGG